MSNDNQPKEKDYESLTEVKIILARLDERSMRTDERTQRTENEVKELKGIFMSTIDNSNAKHELNMRELKTLVNQISTECFERFVTKEEFVLCKNFMDKADQEYVKLNQYKPVEIIAYGIVATTAFAVLAAIIGLVVKN